MSIHTTIQRNEWIFGSIKNPLEDKEYMVKHECLRMLNRTTRMFDYKGLPDTIPVKDFETQLQVAGFSTFAEHKDNFYTFTSGLGGEPNVYYLPTISVVANPALNFSETYKIDKNCVVVLNDHYYQGMMPLFSKYARLLVEAELSLLYAIRNARVPAIIEADNDNTKKSAEIFFEKIIEGTEYGVVESNDFFEGIKSHDFYKEAYIKDLIESIQYIKGSWYNEIGINAAFNMKREAINEAEATLNEDILYPTIDTMLECRQIACDKINKMFGLNISVDLSSIWKKNRKQDMAIEEKEKAEIDVLKTEAKEGDGIVEDDRNPNTTTED